MDIGRHTKFEELPDVLVPNECALYLGLDVRTVRAYIREGKLRAARCGRNYRIRRQWLVDFLTRASR